MIYLRESNDLLAANIGVSMIDRVIAQKFLDRLDKYYEENKEEIDKQIAMEESMITKTGDDLNNPPVKTPRKIGEHNQD